MTEFRKKLSLLNPTKFVNDENVNIPLNELQSNIEYILNFLNGNKALLQGVYGNLWDYDKNGRRLYRNSGKFDTYKKANSFISLTDLTISNDAELFWDRTNERTVYKGWSNKVESREKWIERELWIPEPLRDQNLIFAIKASGCTQEVDWDEENAECETIAIQILGGEENVEVFKEVGPWVNHSYYSNNSYGDPMRTVIVPFKAADTTKSVKIKIYRTKNSGYLHIDKVFIGGVTLPYDNEVEQYQIDRGGIQGIDINEFFDYNNVSTKVISSTVLGHKVAQDKEKSRGNDIVTWYQLNQYIRDVLSEGSIFFKEHVTPGTIGTTGTSGETTEDCCKCKVILPIDGVVQGVVELNTEDKVYRVDHPEVCSQTYPQVTLTMPTSGSQLFAMGVYDVNPTYFYIVISDIPSENGYKINWSVGNTFSPYHALRSLNLPAGEPSACDVPEQVECEISQTYPNIFKYDIQD
jgi:hypothetical protein